MKPLTQNMWSQYAGGQASGALNAMGAGLLGLYTAKERGITRHVKTCQGKYNFHEHMWGRTVTNFVLICYIISSGTRFIPRPVMPFYPMQIQFR